MSTTLGRLRLAMMLAFLLAIPGARAQEAAEPAVMTATATDGKALPDSVALLTGSATEGQRRSAFGGFVLLEQQLGIGTFVSDSYARNAYYAWLLSLRPRYYFTNRLFLELRIDLQQELTSSYATTTTHKRQIMPSDTLLTLKYQDIYRERYTGIAISPFIRLGAPTSYESTFRDQYLSAAAGFDLTRLFGPVYVDYLFRFNKNFNRYPVATLDVDASRPTAIARTRGNEELGANLVAAGINNTSFSIYNSLTATYIITDAWSVTLQLALLNAFTYNSYPKDEFAADAAKGGRGQSDTMYGTIDVSYQPFEHVGFSVGVSSVQPPKTANNESFRFPFFDFVSEANNYTYYYLDVYATF